MFQNLIPSRSPNSKTVFYAFFLHIMVFEKPDNCRNWWFARYKDPKNVFCKETFIKICFFYKSNSLQNLIRCKTCFFEIWHVLKFSIQHLSSLKKLGLSLTHLKLLIQSMTHCTIKYSKTDYLQTLWPKFFFIKKNFFRNNFSKNARKSQLWRLNGVYWPSKRFESAFSNIICFSKKVFSSKSDALYKSWCKFWRYGEIQLKNRQHVNSLIQKLILCKTLIQTLRSSSRLA